MARKSKDTEQTIVEAGIKLIKEKGYSDVTIESICRSAGIGRSTFYTYFNGIEELVAAHFKVLNTYTPERMAWIFSSPHPSERVLKTHLSLFCDPQNFRDVSLYSLRLKYYLSSAKEENLRAPDVQKKILAPMVEEAQQKGEILNLSRPEDLCESAVTLQWGNIMMWCISNGSFDRLGKLKKNLEDLYNIREDLRTTVAMENWLSMGS